MSQNSDPLMFTSADWRLLDSLEVRNLSQLKGITDDMAKAIIREISEGVNAGEGISKLSSRISKATGVSKNRATVIARTETINSATDAALLRFEQYGVTEFRYIAASDTRVCARCATNNGKVFKTTDLEHRPPIHPQCRCAVAPIVNRKKEVQSAQKQREMVRDTIIKSTKSKVDTTGFVDYRLRSDLSKDQIKAIAGYQDNHKGNLQESWDCPIPAGEKHKNCYVVNHALRSPDFKEKLSDKDIETMYTKVVAPIDSAMEVSVIQRDIDVIKGLDDAEWLLSNKKYSVGEEFVDYGYGSFSLSPSVAESYATARDDCKVFIRVSLKEGSHGIYLGTDNEILLPRGFKGTIRDIFHYDKGEFVKDSKAIVYNIIADK